MALVYFDVATIDGNDQPTTYFALQYMYKYLRT